MHQILGTEQYNNKKIVAFGICHGIAGKKVEFSESKNIQQALEYFREVGGKRFVLYFDDGTKVLWDWNKEKEAFIPDAK